MHVHRKRQPSFIASYCISSLLQIGISAQYANLHHSQISHISLVHTSAAHILPCPEPDVQLPAQTGWVPAASAATEAAWSHQHTQIQAGINWRAEGSSLCRMMVEV